MKREKGGGKDMKENEGSLPHKRVEMERNLSERELEFCERRKALITATSISMKSQCFPAQSLSK